MIGTRLIWWNDISLIDKLYIGLRGSFIPFIPSSQLKVIKLISNPNPVNCLFLRIVRSDPSYLLTGMKSFRKLDTLSFHSVRSSMPCSECQSINFQHLWPRRVEWHNWTWGSWEKGEKLNCIEIRNARKGFGLPASPDRSVWKKTRALNSTVPSRPYPGEHVHIPRLSRSSHFHQPFSFSCIRRWRSKWFDLMDMGWRDGNRVLIREMLGSLILLPLLLGVEGLRRDCDGSGDVVPGVRCDFESPCPWRWREVRGNATGFRRTTAAQVVEKMKKLGEWAYRGPIRDSSNKTDGKSY